MSKFSDIIFPFYGLNHLPKKIKINTDKIEIITHDNLNKVVWDKNYKTDTYFNTLLCLDNRIIFDYTAINIQQLVLTNYLVWGVDNTGKIHNLYKKQKFPVLQSTIAKTHLNLLWFEKISYPFEIPNNLEKTVSKFSIGLFIYIDKVWYLYEINDKYKNMEYLWL